MPTGLDCEWPKENDPSPGSARWRGVQLLIVAGLLSWSAACALPRPARTHEVLKPGVMSAGLAVGAGIGDVTVKLVDFDDNTSNQDGRSGVVTNPDTSGAVDGLAPFMVQARLGIFDPCELGIDLGVPRLGGELRCRGFRPSGDLAPGMAYWFGGAWKPVDGWEGGAGLDFGRWFGHFAPFFNIAATFGTHTHNVRVPARFGTPDSDDLILMVTELAARAEFGAGLAYRFSKDEDNFILTLSIVPHFSIWSQNPPSVVCDDCVRIREVRAFRDRYGIAFLIGAEQRFRLWDEE